MNNKKFFTIISLICSLTVSFSYATDKYEQIKNDLRSIREEYSQLNQASTFKKNESDYSLASLQDTQKLNSDTSERIEKVIQELRSIQIDISRKMSVTKDTYSSSGNTLNADPKVTSINEDFTTPDFMSVKSSTNKSLVGSSYYSFGYLRQSQDFLNFQSNNINLRYNQRLHKNFDLLYNIVFGKTQWEETYDQRLDKKSGTRFAWSLGARFHYKFELQNRIISSIDPFISASMGYDYLFGDQMVSVGPISFTPITDAWPWSIVGGLELKIGERFSLAPYFEFTDVFAIESESYSLYGIHFAWHMSENFGLMFGYSTNSEQNSLHSHLMLRF